MSYAPVVCYDLYDWFYERLQFAIHLSEETYRLGVFSIHLEGGAYTLPRDARECWWREHCVTLTDKHLSTSFFAAATVKGLLYVDGVQIKPPVSPPTPLLRPTTAQRVPGRY